MSEAQIQANIVKYLRSIGYFCYSTPNEQTSKNPVHTGQLVAMGLYPGMADLTVWLGNGKIAYLEVKTDKGQQSDRQRHFQEKCTVAGYFYAVVRSVEDVKNIVESWKNWH